MSLRAPISYARPAFRLSLADLVLIALSPPLALYLRHANLFSPGLATPAVLYWLVSLLSSLFAFVAFGVSRGVPGYFSVHELADVAKAVVAGEVVACALLFSMTRLDGVPRSTPVIHALFLGVGVFAARFFAHLAQKRHRLVKKGPPLAEKHVILVGVSDLASIYLDFLEACAPAGQRVIALLDEDPRWTGRSVKGVRVYGGPADLEPLIEEFEVHGVHTNQVVASGEGDGLSPQALFALRRVCARRRLEFLHLPRIFGIAAAERPLLSAGERTSSGSEFALPGYFRYKRAFDLGLTLLAGALLLPLLLIAALLAFVDVGSPILFWQQRLGRGGAPFSLHKIRTLRPLFDWGGERIAEERRISWIGRLLRRTKLDELPQLGNVLIGDMSLIGPRPLLEKDQPPAPSLRLRIRPGITGWAQVSGGILLSPLEKEELDEWYIRNASFALDLSIIGLTLASLLRGERRCEEALAKARALNGAARAKEGALFPSAGAAFAQVSGEAAGSFSMHSL